MTNDEKVLHGLVYQLEAAWNAADAASFAALFAEDADFIHILGGYYTGRAAIEAGHRMIFGTIYKGSSVRYSVEKIRFLRPDVADHFSSPVSAISRGRCDATSWRHGRTIIAEKPDGKWQIVNLQNTRITEAGAVQKEPGTNQR